MVRKLTVCVTAPSEIEIGFQLDYTARGLFGLARCSH